MLPSDGSIQPFTRISDIKTSGVTQKHPPDSFERKLPEGSAVKWHLTRITDLCAKAGRKAGTGGVAPMSPSTPHTPVAEWG